MDLVNRGRSPGSPSALTPARLAGAGTSGRTGGISIRTARDPDPGQSTSRSTRRPQQGGPGAGPARQYRGRISVRPRTFPLWIDSGEPGKTRSEPPVPLGAAGAPVSAEVPGIPVAHAGRAAGARVRQADVLFAGFHQGALEIAGDLAKEGSVRRRVQRVGHRRSPVPRRERPRPKAAALRACVRQRRARGRRYATTLISTSLVPPFPR